MSGPQRIVVAKIIVECDVKITSHSTIIRNRIDGCRVLSHQFSTSSLARLGSCIKKCCTCKASDKTPAGVHPPVLKHLRPGQSIQYTVFPTSKWPNVVQRVVEQKESLRTVAAAYGVSHETIRRIIRHVQQQRGQQEV